MQINFKIRKEVERTATLEDVLEDQFFIDETGRLCQKMGKYCYNIIADRHGKPASAHVDPLAHPSIIPIRKILPDVERITYE